MNEIFLTQEIGSIQRPLWRQFLSAPKNNEWIGDAVKWGQQLEIQELDELKLLLQKDKRTESEKKRIVEISTIYVVKMLENAGLDRVFNGEQPRTEMYDTLARNTNGIKHAGFVNSFDANYFRKGILTDHVYIEKNGIEFFIKEIDFLKNITKKQIKPCQTGPYTMTDWSYLSYYKRKAESTTNARRDAVLDFASDVINPILKEYAKNEIKVIQLDEPAASTNENEAELVIEGINECFKGIHNNVEKAVHLCYSDYGRLFPALADCSANIYLIECTNHEDISSTKLTQETIEFLKKFNEYGLKSKIGIGVIDIHSDIIETPKIISDRILSANKIINDPKRIQVNPDCGLRTRRWNIAYAKLKNMVKGAQLAREAIGG